MGVNPGEVVVRAKAGAQVKAVNPVDGAFGTKTQPIRFKPKSGGSLIPPKRKLVKKMMWDSIVQAIASCFYPITKPTESTLPIKHNCKKKKNNKKKSALPNLAPGKSNSSSNLSF